MSRHRAMAFVAVLGLLMAAPVLAQEEQQEERGAVLSLQGGGFSPLRELDDSGNVDFETGYNLGGGAAYQFNEHVALRGNFHFARSVGRERTPTIANIGGVKYNRYLYDADVQLRYPFESGVAPYLFVGGGAITIDPSSSSTDPSFTKKAAKAGLGLSVPINNSNTAIFIEGAGWFYNWDRNGFAKGQFDTTWNGGISYRF